MLFVCYDKCSTCKKAEKYLTEHGVKFTKRPIKEQNPSAEEISEWYKKSNLPIKKLFNTSGKLYREQNIKDKINDMSDEEMIKILATSGMMIKRPVLVSENTVLFGFKEDEYDRIINSL